MVIAPSLDNCMSISAHLRHNQQSLKRLNCNLTSVLFSLPLFGNIRTNLPSSSTHTMRAVRVRQLFHYYIARLQHRPMIHKIAWPLSATHAQCWNIKQQECALGTLYGIKTECSLPKGSKKGRTTTLHDHVRSRYSRPRHSPPRVSERSCL